MAHTRLHTRSQPVRACVRLAVQVYPLLHYLAGSAAFRHPRGRELIERRIRAVHTEVERLISEGDTVLEARYQCMKTAARVRRLPLRGLSLEERRQFLITLGMEMSDDELEAAEFVDYDPCLVKGIPITHATLNISDTSEVDRFSSDVRGFVELLTRHIDFGDLTHGFSFDDMHVEDCVEHGQFNFDVRNEAEVDQCAQWGTFERRRRLLNEPARLGTVTAPQRGTILADLCDRPHSVTPARGGVRWSLICQVPIAHPPLLYSHTLLASPTLPSYALTPSLSS